MRCVGHAHVAQPSIVDLDALPLAAVGPHVRRVQRRAVEQEDGAGSPVEIEPWRVLQLLSGGARLPQVCDGLWGDGEAVGVG